MRPRVGYCGAAIIIFGLAGCAHRQCEPVATRARGADDLADLNGAVRQRLRARAAEASFNVLVLSGGGAYGAWGAGVLDGWRDATSPRPPFDIVTGISTGALLATFAFLGTPDDDDAMRRAFTTTTNDDVYRKKFLLAALFSDSLYSTAPFEELLERYLPDETLGRVAEAGRQGRRLYVGTVDLDEGTLAIWNMTELAAAGQFDLYRRVIRAAAAIPVLFPPVMLDGKMHVDGGARSQLFLRKRLLPVLRAVRGVGTEMRGSEAVAGIDAASAAAVGEATTPAVAAPDPAGAARRETPVTVWVIVNGRLGVWPVCVDDHLLSIAQRSAETLIDANGIGELHRTLALAGQESFEFRLSVYNPAESGVQVPVHEFIPEAMQRLEEEGRAWGLAGRWMNTLPPIDEERL